MSNTDKVIKVTPELIKEMVSEERQRMNETLELKASHPSQVIKKVKEVEASDLADSLSKCMNYYQACKIKESKMIEELKRLQEVKKELRRRIIKGI
jgi:glycine/serine hydroxymethyltransferase